MKKIPISIHVFLLSFKRQSLILTNLKFLLQTKQTPQLGKNVIRVYGIL